MAKRVIIIGAGEAGRMIVREIAAHPDSDLEVVGFLDDDPALQGKVVGNVPVLGTSDRLVTEAEGYAINRVNRAKGDAQRYVSLYEEYRLAKDVTRRRLYLETMAELLPQIKDKVIIDERLKGVLPLLNLGGAKPPAVSRGEGGGR